VQQRHQHDVGRVRLEEHAHDEQQHVDEQQQDDPGSSPSSTITKSTALLGRDPRQVHL
jgi:hypothetical protein